MKIYGKSDIGQIRKINQDRFSYGFFEDRSLWTIVCDGMGGPNGGEQAAELATNVIKQNMIKNYLAEMTGNQIKNLLYVSVNIANIKILKTASADLDLIGMGTTVVVSIIKNNTIFTVHAGDSRLYIMNQQLTQLTKDHSMVQALVDQGDITEYEARIHPEKNLITNALGIKIEFEPDYTETNLKNGDKVLICTDGLTNSVDDKMLFKALNNYNDCEKCVDYLIDKANELDGKDNITAVLISL